MQQEYTISTGYKIVYSILIIILAAFGIFMMSIAHEDHNFAFILFFSLVIIAIAIVLGLYVYKRLVTVSDHEIVVRGSLGTKQISVHDVKGFRSNGKTVTLYPANESIKKIKINDFDAIGKSEELKEWLNSNLRNLDQEEYEQEKAAILQSNELGFTEQERETKFKRISRIALIYNLVSLVLMLVSIFYKTQVNAIPMLLLVYPLIGLAIIALSKGIVTLYAKKSSAYPSTFVGIILACLALFIQSMSYNKFLSFNLIWMPALITASALIVVISIIILKQPNQNYIKQLPLILMVSTAYSFGAICQIDIGFDTEDAKVYHATVTYQYVNHGKSTSYHIKITAWGPEKEENDVVIPSSLYDKLGVGSTVAIHLQPGRLNIPWYYITE